MLRTFIFIWACILYAQEPPLRLAVAGLIHGHVDGFFRAARNRSDIRVEAIFDPDRSLQKKYGDKYGFTPEMFYTDLNAMLDRVKPEAVAAFTSTKDHPEIVNAAAQRHIPVMMEKPLAVSMRDAKRMQSAAQSAGIPVIVNYETTWYASHAAMRTLMKTESAGGEIRKMVAMDGHSGPKEIGVGPEFLAWLTDPEKNGAGALYDFGCYGANLMTWMMDNQRPLSVMASTHTSKPSVYEHVDDEATIVVEYPRAQGIIQGSWNWPFARKDFELYTERAQAIAVGGNVLRVRMPGKAEEIRTPSPLPAGEQDFLSYLIGVVRGGQRPSGLSSLENNMIVTEILEAARESARTGQRVVLTGH